jgi:hypothetical protein
MTDNAVATLSKTQRAIGNLPPEMAAMVELRRANNIIAAQIAETNWGKGMDRETRRAIADWGRRHEIDVNTEINVLGGNIYLNSMFYLGRLAKMIERGLVEYAVADHVEADPRLGEFPDELKRRIFERIKFQIPDIAKSAVVARVKLRNSDMEFNAAKWCGGRGTNSSGKLKDPVGEEFPVETSESRAWRRVLKLLVSHVPDEIRRIQQAEEDAQVSLSTVIETDRDQQRVDSARVQRQLNPPLVADVHETYGKEAKPTVTDRDLVRAEEELLSEQQSIRTEQEGEFQDDRDLI